ncbi:MAG: hypothetical protein ACTSU4_12325 [Promethearchaeota archaeon]
MVKLIQDIWIQKKNGIVLFSRVFNKKIEDQLFGALMSALNSFAEQLSEGGLSNFELSDKKFTLIKKKDLLFICNYSKKVKEKKVNAELEAIAEKFLKLYPEVQNENFDYELSKFEEFEKVIEDALQEPIKKFWEEF